MIRTLTADRGDAGRRLDLVLRRRLADVSPASRTRVQKWIENGQVTVNGKAVRRVAARIALGDVVAATIADRAPRGALVADEIALDVLYEDDHLIAVNKPPGLVVHPTYKHARGTIINALWWQARNWPSGRRPSLIGRLDKLTSGIVLAAKTRHAHAALQRAMAARGSAKDYLAVVYGRVGAARGEIDLRLARDLHDQRRVVCSKAEGAPSLTRFERLARVDAPRAGLSLLRCRLVTGRTHQIRVHLAARGWPIVGDPMYGEPRWSRVVDPTLAETLRCFERQALHAWRLAFVHPLTGASMHLEAPIPTDLAALLRAAELSLTTPIRRT